MGENLPPLGDVADAGARPTVWRPSGDLGAVEAHLPAPRRQEPNGGLEERRLAHTVPSHQAHELARADLEVHPPEYLGLAVGDVEPANGQHRPPRAAARDRPRGRADRSGLAPPAPRTAPSPGAGLTPCERSAGRTPCHAR